MKEAHAKFVKTDHPATDLPKFATFVRSTNLIRQEKRPTQPKNFDFDWVPEALPDNFLQIDITVGPARHIVFYTDFTANILKQSKMWFVDGTIGGNKKLF